jgi:alkylation response protein AidB-like acyl-CoA dehydrogenase
MKASSLGQTEREVVEALGEFLAKEAALEDGLAAANSTRGFDPNLQRSLAKLGFFGVSIPPELGGLGLPSRVAGEFCVESGRVLLGGPWLEQVLAVSLLGTGGVSQLLADLLAGTLLVSLPLDQVAWRRPPVAEVDGPNARFSAGRFEIGFAVGVDGWLVPARNEARDTAVLVHLTQDPGRCNTGRNWSELSLSYDVDVTGARGTVLGDLADGVVSQHVLTTARLLACVSVGSTEALLATTTSFLQLREQFGRPLGSFQALQHKMADVFIELEHTRSLVRGCFEPMPDAQLKVLVAMAKVAADRLSVGAAERALQAHGGLGFTWELPIHHYLKEALRRRTLPQPTALYREDLRRILIEERP